MVTIALGQPAIPPQEITLSQEQLDRCTGVYAINENENRTITREGPRLYSQRSGGQRYEVHALSETEFFFPDSPNRLVFVPDASGRFTRVQVRPRVGMVEEAKRTEQKIAEHREISVSPAVMQKYVGVYELAPNFKLAVTLEGDKLMTQATGQPKVQVYPESEVKFFLKVTDAQIEFTRDDAGNVTALNLHQGGKTIPARRVKE
jgi:hypothetical protein